MDIQRRLFQQHEMKTGWRFVVGPQRQSKARQGPRGQGLREQREEIEGMFLKVELTGW